MIFYGLDILVFGFFIVNVILDSVANETRIKATLIDKYVESVNMMTERYILCFSFDNRIKYFDVSYFTYKKYLVNGY